MKPKSIAIIHSNIMRTDNLIRVLRLDFAHVAQYTNIPEAADALKRKPADIIVANDKIAQRMQFPANTSVIIVDAPEEAQIEHLRKGAVFAFDNFPSDRVMLERIIAILRRAEANGPSGAPQSKLRAGWLAMNFDRRECVWNGHKITLTRAEFLLLHKLAQHPERLFTRAQLLEELTVATKNLRTIDSHMKRMRAKIRAADPDFDDIRTHHNAGYSFHARKQQKGGVSGIPAPILTA